MTSKHNDKDKGTKVLSVLLIVVSILLMLLGISCVVIGLFNIVKVFSIPISDALFFIIQGIFYFAIGTLPLAIGLNNLRK